MNKIVLSIDEAKEALKIAEVGAIIEKCADKFLTVEEAVEQIERVLEKIKAI